MRLYDVFTDHMVFQANKPIRVFGEGTGTVSVTFLGETVTLEPQSGKKWVAEFAERPYGGPYTMTVEMPNETVILSDIYVGEVILCAGQSNMAFCMGESGTSPTNYLSDDKLRTFAVTRPISRESFSGRDGWQVCDKQTVNRWSAIGYHLGCALREQGAPAVGIITCAQGASVIQSWVDTETMKLPAFDIPEDQYGVDHSYWKDPPFNMPTFLYYTMFKEVMPLAVKNVVWYQGESNTYNLEAANYGDMLRAMIALWRRDLQDETLPFYVVQIADCDWHDRDDWRLVQRKQAETEDPDNGIFVIESRDVCERNDIHPKTKDKLARRIFERMTKQ